MAHSWDEVQASNLNVIAGELQAIHELLALNLRGSRHSCSLIR